MILRRKMTRVLDYGRFGCNDDSAVDGAKSSQ
jgi:hypothetical protein